MEGYSENMSPDPASSPLPDRTSRPIRPLPKRRLRERLSPDVADTITFPPAPETAAPLFYYPYNLKEESGAGAEPLYTANRENGTDQAYGLESQRNGLGAPEQKGITSQARRALVTRPAHHEPLGHSSRTLLRSGQSRYQHPQPPPSTSSSADGYDSFENTNNKKKRKIPAIGEGNLNGVHLLHDSGGMGLPSPPATGDEGLGDPSRASLIHYHNPGAIATNGQPVSGPGRGRYGRARNVRSPLRTLPDSNGSWALKNGKLRPGSNFPSPSTCESGIISNAIANAEKVPVPPGQENVSLLQQQASTKANSTSQFTFTFDSQVPGTLSWPGSDPAPSQMRVVQDQLAQVSDNMCSGVNTRGSQATQGSLSGPNGTTTTTVNATVDGGGKGFQNQMPQKKSKRRSNSLLRQAKQRRQQTEVQNYHHPPSLEDIWICEFCEYERIFGRPPEALIRQYEIKDRRRKREEAERRRLLEKAKMKSRKGKKASKLQAKSNATTQYRNPAPPTGPQPPNQEKQGEEFDEDDYYEEDVNNGCCLNAVHDPGTHARLSATADVCGHGGASGAIERDNRVPVT